MTSKDETKPKFYLAHHQIRGLSIRKKGSADFHPLDPGLVSISSAGCSFEREGRQEYRFSESVEFQFDLADRTVRMEGTVTSVNRWTPWDDNYQDKTYHCYQADFDGELESGALGCIAGCRKKTGG